MTAVVIGNNQVVRKQMDSQHMWWFTIASHTFFSKQWLETIRWICEPRCSNASDCLQSYACSQSLLNTVIGNNQLELEARMFQGKWRFIIACLLSQFTQCSDWKQSDRFRSHSVPRQVTVYNRMFALTVYSMQRLETIR